MQYALTEMKKARLIFLFLVASALAVTFAIRSNSEPGNISAQVLSTPVVVSGFSSADEPRPFSFPADFGPHPDFQVEWWYYTGNLETAEGRHFGYQLTIFRRALLPPNQFLVRSSDWATNQIYMGHFALTDVQDESFHAFERFERGAAGLAGAENKPYHVWLEDWDIKQMGEKSYLLSASNEGISLELQLSDQKGPVLQGVAGYSQKGPQPGNASYYYSQTKLLTKGKLQIDEEIFAVNGFSWKDHEYSTSALSTDQVGWDWFSIQLADGYELMLYQIRRTDGSIDPFSSGTLIAPDGSTQTLGATDFVIVSKDTWRSPHSGALYPMSWVLQIPSADLELKLEPFLQDQELNLSFIYWEGAVQIAGAHNGQTIKGAGYVEMTGYADPIGG